MSYGSSPHDPNEIYPYSYIPPQNFTPNYVTDGGGMVNGHPDTFWTTSSPRSESPSAMPLGAPFQLYTAAPPHCDHHHHHHHHSTSADLAEWPKWPQTQSSAQHPPFVRVVKRRTTANKKERRRTMSINNAYSDLRDCIPNVPADTKLSKIKTLRLATSYISYLTGVLETDDPAGGFKAELVSSGGRKSHATHQINAVVDDAISSHRRTKGRTGWPQHVWALELKQEQM